MVREFSTTFLLPIFCFLSSAQQPYHRHQRYHGSWELGPWMTIGDEGQNLSETLVTIGDDGQNQSETRLTSGDDGQSLTRVNKWR